MFTTSNKNTALVHFINTFISGCLQRPSITWENLNHEKAENTVGKDDALCVQ